MTLIIKILLKYVNRLIHKLIPQNNFCPSQKYNSIYYECFNFLLNFTILKKKIESIRNLVLKHLQQLIHELKLFIIN